MSAGVSDQRMKGQGNQVSNGPKEHVNEHEDFDSWRAQQHQGYTGNPISTSMPSDPYMSNYYGTSFPYPPFTVSDGTWSNSEPITFLSGYGTQMGHDTYTGMDGMFGGAFGQPAAPATSFNYFHGNGDYSTWGNSQMSRKPHYDEFYRPNDTIYPGVETLKGIDHGMQGLGLGDQKVDNKEVKEMASSSQPKKMSWATIASQPAKPPQIGLKKKGPGMPPRPMVLGKHMDIGTWEGKNGSSIVKNLEAPQPTTTIRPTWAGPMRATVPPPAQTYLPPQPHRHPVAMVPQPQPLPQPQINQALVQIPQPQKQVQPSQSTIPSHPVLDELRVNNNYNPVEFDLSANEARFFVIKSYSEDDIHRSIKYEIWCSTEHGNKRLDQAFHERESVQNGVIYLFFSVNGSGHFCGMARMVSPVDYNASSSVWSQDKWKGQFKVRWIYVKDVPNVQLRHIRLENNENKPVTNSRDTQEVPFEKGKLVLRVMHSYRHTTSIFDDFIHYERRQEEEDAKKEPPPIEQQNNIQGLQQSRMTDMLQKRNWRKVEREGRGGGRGGGRREQ